MGFSMEGLMMNVNWFNPKVYSLPLTINDCCHLLDEINGEKILLAI